MSVDDLYIAVGVLGTDVYVNTFNPTGTVSNHDLSAEGRYWVLEEQNVYTVEDWVYYDPMEWGVAKATSLYGSAKVDDTVVEVIEWHDEVVDGFDVKWAIRDADLYEQTIKQLEGAIK